MDGMSHPLSRNLAEDDTSTLAEHLAAYRSGDVARHPLIVASLQHLIRVKDPEKLGAAWDGLLTAVRRLRDNDIPAERAEKYASDAIRSALRKQARDESYNILPTRQQRHVAKKRDEPPPQPITRDPDADIDMTALYNSDSIQMLELRDHIARTPMEEQVLDYLFMGTTQAAIAEALDITPYRVKTIIATFKRRASEL